MMPPHLNSPAAVGVQQSPVAMQKHRKLVDAAEHFEAVFLNELLRPMTESSDADSEDASGSGGQGAGSSTLSGMGSEALAKAIASAGGFGIARHIVSEVEAQQAHRAGN